MGPARMRESLTTTPGIREQPRPEAVIHVASETRKPQLTELPTLFPVSFKPLIASGAHAACSASKSRQIWPQGTSLLE